MRSRRKLGRKRNRRVFRRGTRSHRRNRRAVVMRGGYRL